MRLPKNLIDGTYIRPRLFLCEPDKETICQLDPIGMNGSFKFNSYSELSFEIARTYNDLLTGETKVFPFYNKLEALRLCYLEGWGYFQLQAPQLSSDGIKESKTITAYSNEYSLSQRYLKDLYINTGAINSVEVMYAIDKYGEDKANDHIVPVTLYNPTTPELSLLHLVFEEVYGWHIGHIDSALATLSRSFEIDRESVYDFLMNEVCEKFNCYIVWDTLENTINIYSESLTSKFIGDGTTNTFILSPPFSQIGTVSVDGYKTTRWNYDATTGSLTLEDTPVSNARIEVVDGALTEWETDVFVSFDNLSQTINIDYDADSIKTVLYVTYGEDENIREANFGLPYLVDLSYYYTSDWMGQDLYDAYTQYLQKSNEYQAEYTNNSQQILEFSSQIDFEKNRLSLQYSEASVNSETVGTYYVRGGSAPNYYYTEVSLPEEYNANTTYYSTKTTNLNEEKVADLYEALKNYFYNYFNDIAGNSNDAIDYKNELNNAVIKLKELSPQWSFMDEYTYNFGYLSDNLVNGKDQDEKEEVFINFFMQAWEEIGVVPLESLYYDPYKTTQTANMDAGWSNKDNINYGYYFTNIVLLNSIEKAKTIKESKIKELEDKQLPFQQRNANISADLAMNENFTEGQLIRLSAFWREDELQLDDIVTTDNDTLSDSLKYKQDAMESGRIELQKLCQPQLQFSMSMANVYALPEFEPIIHQFQLGKVIKVGLRSDYIKQSRLLQIDLNFDDFSDFSVEFGELTNLRTQSDIHADLLKKAVQAGKSVATNGGRWTKGSEQATKTDLKIQQGLLDAVNAIKSIDATQAVSLDKYGLHLEKIDQTTGEKDPKQAWFVNNSLLFSDDGFKTSKTGIGEFIVDGETFYGVIAEAMLAGYIEGSKIVGGTINIGDGAFVVHENGVVTMGAPGTTINGYATTGQLEAVDQKVDTITGVASANMYRVEITTTDSTVISSNNHVAIMTCSIYSWDALQDPNNFMFRWKRTSTGLPTNEGEVTDEVWNNMPEHQGIGMNKLEINHIDVLDNSNFTCEVDLPE